MADEQLILLQQKVDAHILEYKSRCDREDERWSNLIDSQERNTKGIEDLTKSTQGMVEAWQAAGGAMKVMSALGHFVKWLSGFAIIGGCVTWIAQHFKG